MGNLITKDVDVASALDMVADVVGSTMGPGGRPSVIDDGHGSVKITKDGHETGKAISDKCPKKNAIIQVANQTTRTTNEIAGDGTTTATVLMRAIYRQAEQAAAAGVCRQKIRKGMILAAEAADKILDEISIPCNNDETIQQVGAISANNDDKVGEIIAKAMSAVGKEGVITVEEGSEVNDTTKIVEGMQFERGYLSPYFITNQKNMAA